MKRDCGMRRGYPRKPSDDNPPVAISPSRQTLARWISGVPKGSAPATSSCAGRARGPHHLDPSEDQRAKTNTNDDAR